MTRNRRRFSRRGVGYFSARERKRFRRKPYAGRCRKVSDGSLQPLMGSYWPRRATFRWRLVMHFVTRWCRRGIEEFFIWAKGELEDLLFQPKNDRLLFAYFGIALQPRRRGYTASLRSEITKKKQLTALIGEEGERNGKLVLLRDPTDDRYPNRPRVGDPLARWFVCRAVTLRQPGHLIVLRHEYLAAISPDRKKWDAIFDFDVLLHMAEGELQSAQAWGRDDRDGHDRSPYQFWNKYIEESQESLLEGGARRAA